MRVVAIVNPVSGSSRTDSALARLVRQLGSRGIPMEVRFTSGSGDARHLAREAIRQTDIVMAVGGDGTVCEIADALAGTSTPLVIWPGGTENLVAKSLGFRADPARTLATLTRGQRVSLDLGVANGTSFLVIAGVGFDAEVVQRLTRERVGHISHLSYTGPLWRTFWEHRWPCLHVQGEGPQASVDWQGRGMVFVGNMARYALGLPVLREARPDDGFLDLCVMPCRNHLQLIGHSLRTLCNRHIEHGEVIYARVTHVRVDSPHAVPIQLDGDLAGTLPLAVSVRPGALQVLVPPDETGGYNPRP